MPSATRYYGIGFFDFGNRLGTDFSGQVEIDRWVFIDKMLFGLMSIFGNGVVSGWTVTTTEAFTLSVNEGFGNINFIAGRTTFPVSIQDIPPNSTVYVYAKIRTRTTFTEEVEFIIDVSATLAEGDLDFLLLAKITSGDTSIEIVDESVRQEIGFIELIKAAIRLHKHRGGSLNPSKIDLDGEVKGQLPSFRIADFDAEKITTGTFDLARMPLLDHQDLQNVGLLTHPQLDTFVKSLEASNTELFGEIGTANLLQLIIAAKLIYEDTESAFFTGTKIDEHMINELVVIPGVTTNDHIDFDNTTATVDLEQNFIEGVPPITGTSFFVNFDSALAWQSAHQLTNLIITGTSLTLAFDDEQETTTTVVENFETASAADENLSTGNSALLVGETIPLISNAQILAETSATNITEGFFSGEFTHQQSFRSQYVKEFTPAADWSTFDSFIFDVRCLNSSHGSVKLFFTDSSGNKSPDFIVLDVNEVTDGDFEMRVIDLTAIPFANDIKSFVIYSDDLVNPFVYFIDNIHIQRALLLPEEGTLRLRYAANAPVVFSTIEWTSTEPPGTELEVRARAANGSVLLNRATFTGFLVSGNNLNLEGTDIEIEVTFLPDSDRLLAPILSTLRVLVLTEAEIDGFAIDTASEFARGSTENAQISGASVTLDTPIFVDSFYFALNDAVNQQFEQTNSDGTTSIVPDDEGAQLFGSKDTPIAPNLIFRAVETLGDAASVTQSSLFQPRSVKRQADRNFVVADTYNDRILELDESGDLVAGVGSINYQTSTTFPIASSVDIRTGILYIIWSRNVSFKTVNVSKIVLQDNAGTQSVQLIKDFDKILGLTTEELNNVNAEGQVMPIFLSSQNAGLAQILPALDSFMLASTGVLPNAIDVQSVFYKAATGGSTLGIHCYIGNFAYIDGIFTPTWADRTEDDGFIIANATIAVKSYSFPSTVSESITQTTNVSSIVEIDQNNNVIFGSNLMQFSPFFPGRVQELDDSTLLIGGIKPGGQDGSPGEGRTLDFRSFSGDSAQKTIQKTTLKEIFFPDNNPHVGSVIVFDRSAGTTIFQYFSPEGILVSDVDIDQAGQYVVAESSFEKSGRVIKLDTVGNIVFSFGEGVYGLINDINVQFDDSIMIST